MSDRRGLLGTGNGPGRAGVVLRAATAADGGEIRALDGLSGATRRLLGRDLAREKPRIAVVAVCRPTPASAVGAGESDGGGVVGFGMATDQPDEVHLLDLAVDVGARRRGIGRRLVAAIAHRATARGASAVTLEVRVSNDAGRGLYEGLGFTTSGLRPGYYRDGEDAVVMWHRDLRGLVEAVADDRTATTGAP